MLSVREINDLIPELVKSAQCSQRLNCVATFLRSCVAQTLSRGFKPHPVPVRGQLRPTPKTLRGAPFIRKQNGRLSHLGGFTPNAIFIRFCISCIFVRFLMNELDEYVFTQNAIASDCAFTNPSSKSTYVF